MDARTANLPKWAQERLSNLEREVTDLHARIKGMNEGTEPGPFYYEHYDPHRAEGKFYLPKHARLMWADTNPDRKIELCDDHGDLKAYSHNGTLIVRPVASNVVKVDTEDLFRR